MKRVIIVTHYFLPKNKTASFRPFAWAKYLNLYGYYPTVVCKNWEENLKEDIIYEKYESYEVYKLNYKDTFGEKILSISNNKFITIIARLLEYNFRYKLWYNDQKKVYSFLDQLLSKDKKHDSLIFTADPFIFFKIGNKLKDKHNHIKWIADYRDEWSTTELPYLFGDHFIGKSYQKRTRNLERTLLKNAHCFTSVSDPIIKRIESLTKKKGVLLENGYMLADFNNLKKYENYNNEDLTFTYAGTLHFSQNIEVFLNAIKDLHENIGELNLKVNFLGLNSQPSMKQYIKDIMGDRIDYINFTDFMNKEESIKKLFQSDFLLLPSHSNIKGIPSSKLYEYIALKKPVFVCLSDNDIIEQTLTKTGQGVICNSPKEAYEKLHEVYQKFLKHDIPKQIDIPDETYREYDRKLQTKTLAETLNQL